MVSQCANTSCGKPLHYLRDGRIFLFKVKSSDGELRSSRPEHFWLCGECSAQNVLESDGSGVHLVSRAQRRRPVAVMSDGMMVEEEMTVEEALAS
jgi:hypothetical protein